MEVTIVYSARVNDVAPSVFSKAERDLSRWVPTAGYGPRWVRQCQFTNGLVAYLSSDTAVFGDMKMVIHDFHKANLAVINLGPSISRLARTPSTDLLEPASSFHAREARPRRKAAS